MMRTLHDVATATGGRLHGPDRQWQAVSTDSRTLEPGALFVALRGPNFDGGEFVAAAGKRGAAGALVARAVPGELPQVEVSDTLAALQDLALRWRAQFALPVVAVAGSNGKTSTKEMVAAILGRRGECLATRGNLNNHIGVPLTLLRLAAQHRSAVVELGANRVGDVEALMRLVRPDVGLITNAGAEHLEGFGDLDGVARGEGETVAGLAADATAVINADDAYAGYWRGVSGAGRVLTFGVRAPADFSASQVRAGVEDGAFVTRFRLTMPAAEAEVRLHAAGAHNIRNALAAAAAASAAGAGADDIVAGLEAFRPVGGRLQLKAGLRGSSIIDDSYNANPSSVRAGLDVLATLPAPRWLVLGDMAELGEASGEEHAGIGAYARAAGVERLFCVGALTPRAAASFGPAAEWFADVQALAERVRAGLDSGVTVLVKGSRVNRLERVVAALAGEAAAAPPGVH